MKHVKVFKILAEMERFLNVEAHDCEILFFKIQEPTQLHMDTKYILILEGELVNE